MGRDEEGDGEGVGLTQVEVITNNCTCIFDSPRWSTRRRNGVRWLAHLTDFLRC